MCPCPVQHGEWRSPAVRIRVVPAYRPICTREPEVVEARNGEAAVRTHIHKKTLLPSLQRSRSLQLQTPRPSAQPRLNLNPIPNPKPRRLTMKSTGELFRSRSWPPFFSTSSCAHSLAHKSEACSPPAVTPVWGWAHSIRGEAGDAAPML